MTDKRRIIIPIAVVVLGAVAWLLLRGNGEEARRIEASGTIEATEADLGFQVGGRVASVAVKEGDAVQPGDLLATLDQAELIARRQAANAQLEAARALLLEMERGARPQELVQARAVADGARRVMQETGASLERTRKLYEGGAQSREDLDRAETAYAEAKSRADQARAALSLIDVGPRAERVDAQRAAVRQAQAGVAQIQATLDNASILAPFGGVVTVRHREPGESVTAGLPVVTLMNAQDRWVRIYVREDQVGRVHVGQNAAIKSDSHPQQTFQGRVTFIASEAEFTPRNVQTTEERVKLVYAVKVAIVGDPSNELKPGVPADVIIEIGN
jgi:HlyD family secretion protein